MRITLIKYISKEIWSIFLTCMMVLIFIIMTSELLKLTEYMVNMGVGLKDIFKLILYLLPKFILFSMPVACLMAVLLSFIRMGSDNEIIALNSSGISLYQLMPPVVIFCFTCLIFSFFLTMFWSPYGSRTEKTLFMDIKNIKSGADFIIKEKLKERVLNTDLVDDVMFYVNSYSPKDGVMEDVFIVDKRHGRENTFVAKKGRFIFRENGVMVQLIDGSVFPDDGDEKSHVYGFKVFSHPLELGDLLDNQTGHKKEPEEMYPEELLHLMRSPDTDSMVRITAGLTFYEMFSLPLAVFLIGIAGAPLGAQIGAQGRTKGIIISLILFLSYYVILMSVRYMCESGSVDPALAVWLPVIFLLMIVIFLLMASSGRFFYGVLNRLVYSRINPR
ncbi:MAG: LptF/LptG family permease [Methanosarcina sp.]|nr:LptF/LptG family permease [Methanosarcina sp.]